MRIRPLGTAVVVAATALAVSAPAAGALTCHSNDYVTQTQVYVCSLYEDDSMLDRAGGASPNEVGYWTDAVGRFGRVRTVEAFVFSVEYMVEVVGDAYEDILGRTADPQGLAVWTDRLRQGTLTREAFERSLANSAEHRALITDTDAVVAFWYDYVLGRAPDPAGLAGWRSNLNAGMSRGQFVASLQNSSEGTSRAIRELYDIVLERSAASADLTGWAPFLRANGRARLLVQLAASSEAFATAEFLP